MNYPKGRQIFLILFTFFILIGAFFISPVSGFFWEKPSAVTEVTHKPIDYFVPGKRIELEAEVIDKKGVETVRCYFKVSEEADFVFVHTEKFKKNRYKAILPAPADFTDSFQYLFLIVNMDQQVVRTQTFHVYRDNEKGLPDWQKIDSRDDIAIYTELAEAPETVPGFSDSISIDVVESSARFGMVSGIYSASAMASSGGSAAGVTGAGTAAGSGASGAGAAASAGATGAGTTATAAGVGATSAGAVTATAGLSTTAVVATGTAVAAATAGTAVAVSSSDSGDGENLNALASISWGDDAPPVGDSFQVIVGNKDIGQNPDSGNIGIKTESGFAPGDCDLVITCVSTQANEGKYVINLDGGAFFRDDQSIHKEGTLQEGESRTYPLHIPEIADTTIRW